MIAWNKWIGIRGPFGRNVAWTHPDLPGVQVRHCGHPTANYPYYVIGVDTLRGATFRQLKQAQEAASSAGGQSQPSQHHQGTHP